MFSFPSFDRTPPLRTQKRGAPLLFLSSLSSPTAYKYDKNWASANGEGFMAHGAIQTRGSGPATSDRLLQALALSRCGHMRGLDAFRRLAPVLVNASIGFTAAQ